MELRPTVQIASANGAIATLVAERLNALGAVSATAFVERKRSSTYALRVRPKTPADVVARVTQALSPLAPPVGIGETYGSQFVLQLPADVDLQFRVAGPPSAAAPDWLASATELGFAIAGFDTRPTPATRVLACEASFGPELLAWLVRDANGAAPRVVVNPGLDRGLAIVELADPACETAPSLKELHRVLVMTDDPPAVRSLVDALSSRGFRVEVCAPRADCRGRRWSDHSEHFDARYWRTQAGADVTLDDLEMLAMEAGPLGTESAVLRAEMVAFLESSGLGAMGVPLSERRPSPGYQVTPGEFAAVLFVPILKHRKLWSDIAAARYPAFVTIQTERPSRLRWLERKLLEAGFAGVRFEPPSETRGRPFVRLITSEARDPGALGLLLGLATELGRHAGVKPQIDVRGDEDERPLGSRLDELTVAFSECAIWADLQALMGEGMRLPERASLLEEPPLAQPQPQVEGSGWARCGLIPSAMASKQRVAIR